MRLFPKVFKTLFTEVFVLLFLTNPKSEHKILKKFSDFLSLHAIRYGYDTKVDIDMYFKLRHWKGIK